jgi:acylphosphatase
MIKHFNIHIYGRVQGVHYRVSAVEVANNLGIKGFARNEKNESVYIEAEGEENSLSQFVDWCRKGPSRAKVELVEVNEDEMKNYTTFAIQR